MSEQIWATGPYKTYGQYQPEAREADKKKLARVRAGMEKRANMKQAGRDNLN